VKFLEEVKLETQSKSRLKHLLVLGSRLLALAALVLAFCLPYIPTDDRQEIAGRKAVSVYIDNSFSMNAENEKGILLEQGKALARQVVNSYDQSDRFQLLTNDFEGRHQRMVSREEFLEFVDEVKSSAKVKKISKVAERMKEALARDDIANKRAFILSDFQEGNCDFDRVKNDSSYFFNLVPIQQNDLANVYIDSIWFKVPVRQLNFNEELMVRIVNQSERELNNLGVKLMINGAQKALATINVSANSSANTSLFFTNEVAGIMQGEVSIKDNPITFDDAFYFSYDVSNKINVLHIGSSGGAVKSIFGDDEFFDLKESSVNAVDYSLFKDLNLIVLQDLDKVSSGLNQELKKFIESGGSIVLLPGVNANVSNYNEFLLNMGANRMSKLVQKETKVQEINLDNYFFDGVFAQVPSNMDLPVVKQYFQFMGRSQSREERLLEMRNGDTFLSNYPVGNGQLYTYAVGTNKEMSNLSRHAIFVTSMLRIAELSNGRQTLFQTIGENEAIRVKTSSTLQDEAFHIINDERNFDVIPSFQNYGGGVEVFVHEQIQENGNYDLRLGEKDITGLAFNYSREESQMKFASKEDIQMNLNQEGLGTFKIIAAEEGANESLNSVTEGTKLWKWFILIALAFLLVEVLLLRFL